MKTKLSFINLFGFRKTFGSNVSTLLIWLILALSPVPCALSQIAQGFNYQAVARNASGLPIINQSLPVRMTIQSDSLGGTIFWQELHSSVITSDQGVINLVIGRGTRQSTSTVATFSAIDWSATPKFLKIEIDYSGWKTLGVSRLWSVPYSMVAGDLAGTVDKLSVKGTTSGLEEALFEVKNKDGQTVFAVYNEGVRIYVSDGAKALKGGFAVGGFGTDKAESTKYLFVGKDSVRIYLDTNPLTKKLKGGFAVGGYDLTKGAVQNYLDVSADSVRIYIDSDPLTKKLKGGFAVGGYDMTKGTNTNYMNVNTDASGIISPSQNRILWYPLKNAFLTGKVLIEDKDSVGENSFASGYESKAMGQYSQALGYKAFAMGDYSTAIGKNAFAEYNSFAFGENATAGNIQTYAIGYKSKAVGQDAFAYGSEAEARGRGSFAFGSVGIDSMGLLTYGTRAVGDYSFALGQSSFSNGKGSFSIGIANTTNGDFSLAMGYHSIAAEYNAITIGNWTSAVGPYSLAMGSYTTASGVLSTAMGFQTRASGQYSTAMGRYSLASGQYSTSMGDFTTASGVFSIAMGHATTASGGGSIATGSETIASGVLSAANGYNTTAPSSYETVIGRYNTSYTPISTWDWYGTDRLFVVGNGTSFAPSNAVTILKNGNFGIGTSNPVNLLHLKGNSSSPNPVLFLEPNEWNSTGDYGELRLGSDMNHYIRGEFGNGMTLYDYDKFYFAGGNVGIGTNTPGYKLQVGNAADGSQARANAWNLLSDASLKTAFTKPNNSLEMIAAINGFYFYWNTGSDKTRQFGFSAQEVEKVLPEIVSKGEDGLLSLDYGKVTPLLVEAMKEQQQQIESYKSQLQILQEKVDKIESLLAKALDE